MLVLIYLFLAHHQQSLGNYWGSSLIHSMLITPFYNFFLPEGHQEHCGKVLTLHLVECLVGFEQTTFWFDCNTLTHYGTLHKQLILYLSNSVIRLVVKFSWLTKIIFQIFCGLFSSLKLNGELALVYESYASGNSNFYYHYYLYIIIIILY